MVIFSCSCGFEWVEEDDDWYDGEMEECPNCGMFVDYEKV